MNLSKLQLQVNSSITIATFKKKKTFLFLTRNF